MIRSTVSTWPVFIPDTNVLVSRIDRSPCSSRNSTKSWNKNKHKDKRDRVGKREEGGGRWKNREIRKRTVDQDTRSDPGKEGGRGRREKGEEESREEKPELIRGTLEDEMYGSA